MLTNTIDFLIKESERMYLARKKAIIPGHDNVRRHFLYPVLMVAKGFDFAKKEFFVYSMMYFVGIILTIIFLKEIPKEYPPEVIRLISSVFIYSVIFLPIFAALFLPPSTYTNSRINEKVIDQLLKLIPSENIDELDKLLQIHHERIETRILFLKRLYALSWAVLLYLFKSFEKLQGIEPNTVKNEILILVFYSIALMLGFLFIQAYSKSTETILTSVKVALIEQKCL